MVKSMIGLFLLRIFKQDEFRSESVTVCGDSPFDWGRPDATLLDS